MNLRDAYRGPGRPGDIHESEERYRSIFERSRDGILLLDDGGTILEANRAAAELLGYNDREKLLGLESVGTLFARQDHYARFQELMGRQGVVTEFEALFSRRNAATFDALVSADVLRDSGGAPTRSVLTFRDIARTKKARQQLERRNARLTTLNSISTTVSSSLELKEVLRSTIDKVLDMLESQSVRIYLLGIREDTLRLAAHKGLSKEFVRKPFIRRRKVGDGFLGRTVLDVRTTIMNNLNELEQPYMDAILQEGLVSTAYIPLVSKGKTLGVMCVSSHVFTFSPGYVEFLAAIGNQIGIAVENANLYESLKATCRELKDAEEQVFRAEQLASLGKLAATIAHEINNPLSAVLTYTRLMMKLMRRKRFGPERLDDISRYLGTMESETARCGEIVKNLLAFSRQSSLTVETHDVGAVVDRALTLIAHDLEMRKIRVVRRIDEGLPGIECDFKQLQQALLNLMSNAAEAMAGGGTLTVAARSRPGTGILDVTVSDTGCGIPGEHRSHIFEPFYTTKEEGKGVGLGLSVVYGIVSRHNGVIEVSSTPGKGSAFRVSLPVT